MRMLRLLSYCLPMLGLAVLSAEARAAAKTVDAPATIAAPAPALAQQLGWKSFRGRDVELSLPAHFRGGSPSDADAKVLITAVKNLGPAFAQIATFVEKNPATFVLFAVDPKPNRVGGVTNVLVAAEQVPANTTLDNYLASLSRILPAQIQIIERNVVTISGLKAGRLVTQAGVREQQVKQLIYVIKQGDTVWTVGYSTGANEYQQRLSTFERSIQTFKTKTRPNAISQQNPL